MDPTAAEIAGFSNVGQVAAWAGLRGAVDDAATEAGSLLLHLDIQGTEHYRVLAAYSREDWEHLINAWRQDDKEPSPGSLARARLLGRAARLAANVPDAPPTATVVTATAPEPGPVTSTAVALPTRQLKYSLIVNQASDESRPVLGLTEIAEAYRRYEDKLGAQPPPHEECTAEQLSAVHALLADGVPPYVDMAVWGPFGNRLMRKLVLTGLQLMPNGTLEKIELKGPPTFEKWLESYRLLKTALISFEAVSPAKLDRYADLLTRYVQRYSPAVWHIIYQADVRTRLEHMERLRRLGQKAATDATAAGGAHPFDRLKPWEWVWGAAVDDSSWWRVELEEPALLVLTRTSSLARVIDHDADVEGGTGGAPTRRTRTTAPPRREQERRSKVHRVSDGLYTANRADTKLCSAYQKGECDMRPGRCPRGHGAHQCTKCLGQHPSKDCSQAPKQPSQPWWERDGGPPKGKGRGKGRGKRR